MNLYSCMATQSKTHYHHGICLIREDTENSKKKKIMKVLLDKNKKGDKYNFKMATAWESTCMSE